MRHRTVLLLALLAMGIGIGIGHFNLMEQAQAAYPLAADQKSYNIEVVNMGGSKTMTVINDKKRNVVCYISHSQAMNCLPR